MPAAQTRILEISNEQYADYVCYEENEEGEKVETTKRLNKPSMILHFRVGFGSQPTLELQVSDSQLFSTPLLAQTNTYPASTDHQRYRATIDLSGVSPAAGGTPLFFKLTDGSGYEAISDCQGATEFILVDNCAAEVSILSSDDDKE